MNKNKSWAADEFAQIDCNDKRLDKRFIKLASDLSRNSQAPTNQSCDDWASTKGAYRFFQNDKIDEKTILTPHFEQTSKRISGHSFVLAIQDTTVIDHTKHKKTKNLGAIGKHPSGKVRMQGLMMHSCLALSPDGLPLGLISNNIWTREDKPSNEKNTDRKKLPIEDKESYKWIAALEETHQRIGEEVNVLTICDRESDIFDFFLEAKSLNEHVLVRASHDRSIAIQEGKGRLFDHIAKQKSLGTTEAEVPYKVDSKHTPGKGKRTTLALGPDGERTRTIEAEVKASKVTLLPSKLSGQFIKEKIDITIIEVTEKNPPEGYEPLHWRLLTTLAIESFDEACLMLKFYCKRWNIEIYFKVLKSGCSVEKSRLSTGDRLKKHLALFSIIAWRIFWLTHVNRLLPEVSCDAVLSENEWKALFCKIHKTNIVPEEKPTVGDVILWIARLGGFLARKCDGHPGPIVIWRGWIRLHEISEMRDIMLSEI